MLKWTLYIMSYLNVDFAVWLPFGRRAKIPGPCGNLEMDERNAWTFRLAVAG